MKNHHAFTMVEMLIVITLISIVSVWGGVNFVEQRHKQILTSTAEQIKADILQARADAISNKYATNTIFTPVLTGGNRCLYIGSRIANLSALSCNANTTVGKYINLPNGLSFSNPFVTNDHYRIFYTQQTGNPTIGARLSPNYTPLNQRGIRIQSGNFRIRITAVTESTTIGQGEHIIISPPERI